MTQEPSKEVRHLDLYALHVRHRGMAKEITDGYAISAAVCLDRHHRPPRHCLASLDSDPATAYIVEWAPPTPEHIRSCGNFDETTRDGAYGLALAAADGHLGLIALRRAEGRTGSDFSLVPIDAEITDDPHLDLERSDLIRLEVSRIDGDEEGEMRSRVRAKIRQARAGRSPVPAIVGVVGFRTPRVEFRRAEA